MRKHIGTLILVAAAALSGCATTPLEGTAKPGRDAGTFAVGTLAPFGSFEWQAAPAYTRLAVARRIAARRLDAGRITVAQAIAVQAAADRARSTLDAAKARADRGDREGARRQLAEALTAVAEVEKLAQGTP